VFELIEMFGRYGNLCRWINRKPKPDVQWFYSSLFLVQRLD